MADAPFEDTRKARLAAKSPKLSPPKNFRPAAGGTYAPPPKPVSPIKKTQAMLKAEAVGLANKLASATKDERTTQMRQLQKDNLPLYDAVVPLLRAAMAAKAAESGQIGLPLKDAAAPADKIAQTAQDARPVVRPHQQR